MRCLYIHGAPARFSARVASSATPNRGHDFLVGLGTRRMLFECTATADGMGGSQANPDRNKDDCRPESPSITHVHSVQDRFSNHERYGCAPCSDTFRASGLVWHRFVVGQIDGVRTAVRKAIPNAARNSQNDRFRTFMPYRHWHDSTQSPPRTRSLLDGRDNDPVVHTSACDNG